MRMAGRSSRLAWPLLIGWCAFLTLLVYGTSLTLPFFFDDFIQIPFVEAVSYADIWRSAQFAYYRPVNFHIWKLAYDLLGAHNSMLHHALNLTLHTANGALTGWLAAYLWKPAGGQVDWRRGFLSASFFLLYPFSYQGVPWIGALNHVLAIFFMLFAAVCFWQVRCQDNGRLRIVWPVLGFLAALLAPFTHENGVLLGPLLLFIVWTTPGRSSLRMKTAVTGMKSVFLWTIPSFFWLLLWWRIPKTGGGLFWNGGEGIWQNSVYALQGVAYPLTWLGGWLRAAYQVNDFTAVLTLSGVAIAIAVFIQRRGSRDVRSLLPWLWSALSLLPVILFLRFDYVINGPRLLMLASVGTAWLWADVMMTLVKWRGKSTRLYNGLGWLLVVLLLVQNYAFIHERMKLHQMLGSAVSQTVELTKKANTSGESAVFINFPSWLAPDSTYAVGHEGVQFWPDYVPDEAMVRVHTGQPADLHFVRVDNIRAHPAYFYGVSGSYPNWPVLRSGPTQLFVVYYEPDQLKVEPVGNLAWEPQEGELLATFTKGEDEIVTLHGATVVQNGRTLEITLTWSLTKPVEDVTVFVHLLDENGNLMAQVDGDPLAGSYPFSQWEIGEAVHDIRRLDAEIAPRLLLVGVYDRLTGERLTALSSEGVPRQENAVQVTIDGSP